MRTPKDRDEFEQKMLWAFSCGMDYGYGIDHENIHEEEEKAIEEFAERNGFKRKKVRYGKINKKNRRRICEK